MPDKPVALITGASRGIGRGIALELTKNGIRIAGVGVKYDPGNQETGLFEVKNRIKDMGGEFLSIQSDISVLENHEKIISEVLSEFGRIDFLVNNAGVSPDLRRDILETTPESFDKVLSVNIRGTFFLTQKVANYLMHVRKKDKYIIPSIVFITSVSSYMSSPSRAEYCISKAALSQAAKIYADKLSDFGINVYEVRPGIIETDMTSGVKDKYDKLIAEGLIPQKRWGVPEDVGKAVASLISGDFNYSTGMAIEVSGGMNINRL
ncbi:3-ketoacyl-ACP reductase [Bacteroidota bacterium]